MSNAPESANTVPKHAVEIVVALAFIAFGALVMWDSARIGAGWAPDGPESGYFPYYIGLLMLLSSTVTLVIHAIAFMKDRSETFVERGPFLQVLKVLIPTAIFVVLIGFLGIYVAGALFIAFFMAWLGRYGPLKILPVSVCVPLFLFMLFEVWFLVPLPKGPLEAMLGY